MLLTQFLLIDSHFIISLLSALVFFATAWLYFDAWSANKKMKETTLFFGFLLLAVSFVAQALIIDQALLDRSHLGSGTALLLKNVFRVLGFLFLIIGELKVPLQPVPGHAKQRTNMFFSSGSLSLPFAFSLPILAAGAGFLYLRRATVGLENHLKPIALAFFLLAISELFSLGAVFRSTNNVLLNAVTGPFGPLWIGEQIFLCACTFVVGKWVFSYLLKRFDTQLFMILTTMCLVIFLTTTIFFTYATLKNLSAEALTSLETDSKVLNYSIDTKKSELSSVAESISHNSDLITALTEKDRAKISKAILPILATKTENSITLTDNLGGVVFNSADRELSGKSLSDNPLVKKALQGQKSSGVTTKDGFGSPSVVISAGVPVKSADMVVGTVVVGYDIDNTFVDGLKSATGLDASVYAGLSRSATTFTAPNGISRYTGITEDNLQIKKTVLDQGKNYSGNVAILNVPYFASFIPLLDTDNTPIGMLFTGRPQYAVLQAASASLELTFIITALLMVFSILPAYWVSKYISEQIH